jgi:hypothetical protein
MVSFGFPPSLSISSIIVWVRSIGTLVSFAP